MKVRDFMKQNVLVATKESSINEVLSILVKNKIGSVPVVDRDGLILGIISDGDILRFLNPNEESIYDLFTFVFYDPKKEFLDKLKSEGNKKIRNIATHEDVLSVQEDDDMEKALAVFAKYGYKVIPVSDKDGFLVGIISRGDVLREINQIIVN